MYEVRVGRILSLKDWIQACSTTSLTVDEEKAFTLARDVDEEAIENDTTSSLAMAASDEV